MSRNFAQPITSRIPLLMPAARICLRLLAWLGSTAGISFCSGALAALFSVVFCHQMFARFGSGLMTSAATAAALSIGLLVGAVGTRIGRSRGVSNRRAHPRDLGLAQRMVRRPNGIGLWIL